MAFIVQENVSVVSVFDLYEKTNYRVCCQALNEIRLRISQLVWPKATKMPPKKAFETREIRVISFKRVNRNCIWNTFNDPTTAS
mmetsp:Transcript_6974/g.13281  ORF Transcript_6974/g.13281 Transcript_6974/m.13281 type:complete len:84 (-) Transcript_6974:626-877(-)